MSDSREISQLIPVVRQQIEETAWLVKPEVRERYVNAVMGVMFGRTENERLESAKVAQELLVFERAGENP